ncbi:uncharacterized protein LOC143286648 [Babylonia areolata]|uniref:uncharacterized protein LOC143286648 n=1 Tax=Babylonia areolata TaxID=304850 RepID=UPI003FD56439
MNSDSKSQRSAQALRWSSSSPNDGQVLYACAGGDVTLPWSYALDQGDVIVSTEWTFQGESQQLVAASIHGNFFATPSFSGRVQLVPNAGLVLSHVTPEDSGNYSVAVTLHDGSGLIGIPSRRSVTLQVADDLMIADHELQAGQQAEAEYDNSTDQWHAVLTCGRFTYMGDPPLAVEWLTPEGKRLPSTLYSQGFFKLFLPNPVTEGNYTCAITPSSQQHSCAHGNGHQQATVEVNGLTTRLALLEAQLRSESIQKNAVINELKAKVESLQMSCQATTHVAFSARLKDSFFTVTNNQVIILRDVLVNIGHAYDTSTGNFTAPVTGTYYFSAMAAPYGNSKSANVNLRSDSAEMGDFVFNSYAFAESHTQTGSLQGVVRLQKGERVWLNCYSANSYLWSVAPTAFSGFLLYEG